MSRTALTSTSLRLIGVIALAVTMAGCLDRFAGCDGYSAHLVWSEPGLYARMPGEGNHGSYNVHWFSRENPPDVTVTENGKSKYLFPSLTVNETDMARFQLSNSRPVGDGEIHAIVNQWFQDLGIEPLTLRPDAKVQWTEECH